MINKLLEVGGITNEIIFSELLQSKSLTDALLLIEEYSKGNFMLKNILLEYFFQNIPREIQNNTNAIHDKSINLGKKFIEKKQTFPWKCNHLGCSRLCIDSHELSKQAALGSFSSKGKAYILEPNLEENSFKCVFENKSIKSISIFPGYCSIHDEELFNQLDNSDQEIDLSYVNLQTLRMLKYYIFNAERKVSIVLEYMEELKLIIKSAMIDDHNEHEYIASVQEYYHKLESKYELQLKQLASARKFYDRLWHGIEQKKYIVDYTEIPYAKLGWGFSQAIALDQEGNCSFDFIFKIDINSKPVLIHAWEYGNIPFNEPYSPQDLMVLILMNKDKIVFSEKFISNIYVGGMTYMIKNFLLPIELEPQTARLGAIYCHDLFFESTQTQTPANN